MAKLTKEVMFEFLNVLNGLSDNAVKQEDNQENL